ncbi:MAG: glycosyl hydrolase 115 family protein [Bacteroidia bacterium]|nr:glycosyl hydrolase 115 family protein [Bacteroidia bacterium]
MKKSILTMLMAVVLGASQLMAIDNKGIARYTLSPDCFPVISNCSPTAILADENDNSAVQIALKALQKDFKAVSGHIPAIMNTPSSDKMIIVGSIDSKYISQIIAAGKIDGNELRGKNEKYIMTVVKDPVDKVSEALVIAGSDRRGTVYGIYELSEQIGVSPWYFWADTPIEHQDNISIERGTYTAGEPAVKYRGIFLNDEAPCLTSWVTNRYGTRRGGHEFYADVFELILRLRGNFMWPAMWDYAFYADDPVNSKTADEMGVVMGTSHHEPMARNHEEWARNPKAYGGVWDYTKNKKELQRFFREGIERAKNTEDLITIGMRGDGDAALRGSDEDNIRMMEGLFKDQRDIIRKVTGKPADQVPQVWALYKEVQLYYEKGLRVPDDVIILISDDNWGDVRKLPNAEERKHKGGWGMYYHVDYVGAPRNSKWLNVTPVQNLWEQMQLTYEYGVDKVWVLNVGDLKPMEYPISLFLDMAWSPYKYSASTLLDHTLAFCEQQFGADQAEEACRILNLLCKYSGRISAELLDKNTYNLESGEWKQVADEWARLEAEALRQYLDLDPKYRDVYQELILFPTQALANVYDMYYSQAMNNKLFVEGNPAANEWTDRCERDFKRDSVLCLAYNKEIAGGKWDGMMTQKHIGYTNWNDNFPADMLPQVCRFEGDIKPGLYEFTEKNGVVVMEAEHYFSSTEAADAKWTVIPYMGRTLSGISLQPYDKSTEGATITYKFKLASDVKKIDVRFAMKSTLPFARLEGHRFMVSIDGGQEQEVNFNSRLNEEQQNINSVYYPTVARRVVESMASFDLGNSVGEHTLTIRPIEPGSVFEKIIIDCGGYEPSYLYGNESPVARPSEAGVIPARRPMMQRPQFTAEQLEQFRKMQEEQQAQQAKGNKKKK